MVADTATTEQNAEEAAAAELLAATAFRRAKRRVFLLGAALLASSALLITLTSGWTWHTPPLWALLAVPASLLAARYYSFRIEYRREAVVFFLTEVPLAFAVVYLGTLPAVGAAALAALLLGVAIRRSSWFKVWLNVTVAVFEVSLAVTVFNAIAAVDALRSDVKPMALIAALTVAAVISSSTVVFAISFFEGSLLARLRTALSSGVWVTLVASVVGALAVAASMQWRPYALFSAIPVAAVWNTLRSHGRTSQRLRDLEELHQSAAVVGRSLHRADVAGLAMDEVQRLLRADRAALLVFSADTGKTSVAAAVGIPFTDLPAMVNDQRWFGLLAEGGASMLDQAKLRSLGIDLGGVERDVIVAPVRDGDRVVAVLLCSERSGATDRFDEGDVIRADALAARLGMALRNAQLHEQIEYEAWHDRLTGLPNRLQLEIELNRRLEAAPGPGAVTVLMLGIDRFRDVNATLGHQAGDRVLVELSRRIGAELEVGDFVARSAGDEVTVLISALNEEAALSRARILLSVAQRPYSVEEFDVALTVNIGVVMSAGDAANVSTLMRRADMSMHWAKTHHTGIEVYREEIDRRTPARLSMLSELRTAIDRRELEVFFQPKLDVSTGTIMGAEALVRWRHHIRGFVPPDEFIPLAETSGLMPELTEQVLQRAVAGISLFDQLGYRLQVAVNLSTLDLVDDKIISRVQHALRENNVDPDQLTLEITETALLSDAPRTLAAAEALRALGSHLSIDDFGTGYSSLSYLRTLPASELKIDRSFVSKLMTDARDEVIVRSTIDLGHNLGLKVVAEGVEQIEALDRLRLLGCDLAQGYCLTQPLPFERFLVWLASSGYPVQRHEGAVLGESDGAQASNTMPVAH